MDDAIAVFRLTHILAGCLGLVSFWVPILSKKGGPVHRTAGRVFALCALYVGATGLTLSIWAITDPPGFFGDPESTQIAPEDIPAAIANTRFLYSITGFLGMSILTSIAMGWHAARTKPHPDRRPRFGLPVLLGAYALWSIGLVAYGVWNLIAAQSDTHPLSGAGSRYWIHVGIGAIGIWSLKDDIAYLRRAPAGRWLSKHMECMLGAGIGFHAAALFFGVNSLVDLHGAMSFAPLIAPFVLGVPIMWWAVARWGSSIAGEAPT